MAHYNSRRSEMLERLFDEDRLNTEYKNAFENAKNERAIALLPEQEKLQAIELAVYEKLFGATSADKKDVAQDAKSATEPKKEEASESNDGKSTGESATPTAEKEKDTPEPRDLGESNTVKVVAGISYRDQAAKTPRPPEEIQLSDREKWVKARREAMKAKMGPAAWHRIQEANKKILEASMRSDAFLDRRNRLLPMRPGGTIHQYSTYAPPTWECKNYWSAENGAQMKEVEQKLNVKVMFIFERDHLFRLWPEPADEDAFEKDTVRGMQLLARCEKFMDFWVWIFVSTGHGTDRVPLTTCLE
ncbi:hypothetical protein EAE96_008399 [Botrytis aclada]|nr:hypothetical protein EAE96_008399 [Botrytis aclada]